MSHLLSFDAGFSDQDDFGRTVNWRVLLALLLNVAAWVGFVAFIHHLL